MTQGGNRPDPTSGPTPPPAVAVEGLSVQRGGRQVLHGIGFEIPRGQIAGLLGPSGSGKSTLIRAIVGVQLHPAGRCEIFGLPAGSAEARRRVGYVAQEDAVYDDLSVVENLRYFAAVLGVGASMVESTLDVVDLAGERKRLVGSLSGGQHGRVSLAAALLGEPELLVLDEPTVGLDPVLRRSLWHLFHELAAGGATLLVSSNVMEEASECDRILLLRDGRLLADDTEAALLARTSTTNITDAFLDLVGGAPS